MTGDNDGSGRAALNVPASGPAHYERNFIRQAVCELRFPTLYELEAPKPPASFALALRKEYPNQQLVEELSVGNATMSRAPMHTFKSKRQRWTVTLKAAAVLLETSHYDSFVEFKERLAAVLKAAATVIDSDFFTRVGLRYINTIPYPNGELQDWVNPALVGPLAAGIYGDVTEHNGRVIGFTPCGGYIFQHGLVIDGNTTKREYTLDFDLSSEDVALSETLAIVQNLHDLEFSLFKWAIGPAAEAYLGPSNVSGE